MQNLSGQMSIRVVSLVTVFALMAAPSGHAQPQQCPRGSSLLVNPVPQPPLLEPASCVPPAPPPPINGVTIVDVAVSACLDRAGLDLGNEPSITSRPGTNEVVLTSFSGSNWGNTDSGVTNHNSSLFYSSDGGLTWAYSKNVPPPPGVKLSVLTNQNPDRSTYKSYCPCDQTVEYGRDGILYATFLVSTGSSTRAIYSARTTSATSFIAWSYKTFDNTNVAQPTTLLGFHYVDQPWLAAGTVPGNHGQTQVSVAYDNLSSNRICGQVRVADATSTNPLDFEGDTASSAECPNDPNCPNACLVHLASGEPLGNRAAIASDGKLWTVFQDPVLTGPAGHCVTSASTTKTLTYLVNVSADTGLSWGVTNSDHPSGAKIVADCAYSFQGYGSKIGGSTPQGGINYQSGVNSLQGGIDAITVDPLTGTAWIVYGSRDNQGSNDVLWLVSATLANGAVTIGTPQRIACDTLVSPSSTDPCDPGSPQASCGITSSAYLPAVAVLPNGEIGVLFLTWDGKNFRWMLEQFSQTRDGGTSPSKTTILATFNSPFTDDGRLDQRIFGDYVSLKAAGCSFRGAYPARGIGSNSINSIDPYFMSAPASGGCSAIVGDIDGSGTIGVSDPFYLNNYLHNGGPRPLAPADVNGDGLVNDADVNYLFNYLFAGGPPPVK